MEACMHAALARLFVRLPRGEARISPTMREADEPDDEPDPSPPVVLDGGLLFWWSTIRVCGGKRRVQSMPRA